jgi:murein DD-endopeptidase MepM/ murein hydrolase activator NlpD
MDFNSILHSHSDVHVIDRTITDEEFMVIDLSENNTEINETLVSQPDVFEAYILKKMAIANAKAAFGGYNEKRRLYKRSSMFSSEQGDRNIHIGMDIWAAAGTEVLAALDGDIHSFKNNEGNGNYGPTIILHHKINNCDFYTLYGHLSAGSIQNLSVGHSLRKGEQIGELGDASSNGGYPPHLHFQIIKNIDNYFGDYPGVCHENDLAYYLANCPDPNVLLKTKNTVL